MRKSMKFENIKLIEELDVEIIKINLLIIKQMN